jgi:hypothetical protein
VSGLLHSVGETDRHVLDGRYRRYPASCSLPAQASGTAAPQAAAASAVPLPGAAPAQEVLPLFEAIDRRYFKPSAEAIAEVTSLLAPGDSRR